MTSRFRMAAVLSVSAVCLGLAAPSFAATTTAPAAKTAKHKKSATHHAKKMAKPAAAPAAK